MDVTRVAAALTAALDLIRAAGAALGRAQQGAEAARDYLETSLQGTHDTDAGQLPAAMEAARGFAETAVGILDAAVRVLEAYRASLVGPGSDPPAPSSRSSTSSRSAKPTEPPAVAKQRATLPGPVQRGAGQKTHGRMLVGDAEVEPLVSGNDDRAADAAAYLRQIGITKPLAIVSHVETKAAVQMARTGQMEATLVLNNVPCGGPTSCDRLLPSILPAGATITVYGTKADGTPTSKTYIGRPR